MNRETTALIERKGNLKVNAICAGTLEDLSLGQDPDDITSLGTVPSNEQKQYVTNNLHKAAADKQNRNFLSCIDGRKCACCLLNSIGVEVEAILCGRQAGGSLIYDVMAVLMDGDIPGVLKISDNASIEEIFASIEKAFEVSLANHTGGCGAANGLIRHMKAIAENPNIFNATEVLMSKLNEYDNYLETDYDNATAIEIAELAGTVAAKLESENWQSEQYTNKVRDSLGPKIIIDPNPEDFAAWEEELSKSDVLIEVLDQDETNPERINKGHKEQGIVFILGDKTMDKAKQRDLGIGDMFVITLDDSKEIARKIAKGNPALYRKALMINLAFHLSVASNLAKKGLPVYFYDARQSL